MERNKSGRVVFDTTLNVSIGFKTWYMSRHDKLRCSKCYKKDWLDYELGRIEGITWQNIKIVKQTGQSFLCQCGNCGHTYRSNSSAAHRLFRAMH